MAQMTQANGSVVVVGLPNNAFSDLTGAVPATAMPNGANAVSVADQTINAASSAMLAGSLLTIPAGKLQIGSLIRFTIKLTKTAAGTAANTFIVRLGVNGTIADAAILTFTLPVGTAVADVGAIEILVTIRGPLSAACLAQGSLLLNHNLAATGLATIPAVCINVLSSAFDATASGLKMSVSCTTAASTVLAFQQVITEVLNLV